MNKVIYILVAIGVAAGLISIFLAERAAAPTEAGAMCTAEARECPDGSFVGREGSRCEFAACPPVAVALGETVTFGATSVTPLRVTEDSRCPIDAQCIQAGNLIVEVEIKTEDSSQVSVMSPGDTFPTALGEVVLEEVSPEPQSGTTIAPSEYRFTFSETN